jgi:uncharacterized membrane protein YheB (UPF0754 family)
MYVRLLRLVCVSLTVQVSSSLATKAARLWKRYHDYCDDLNDDDERDVIIRLRKELCKCYVSHVSRRVNACIALEMQYVDSQSVKATSGFSGTSRRRAAASAASGASLEDINNNVRLLVDAVRRLTEVVVDSVRLLFPCVSHDL